MKLGARESAATARLTRLLGRPTAFPPADCAGGYRNVEWHDLIVQFKRGRFAGYRYWFTELNHAATNGSVPRQVGTPALSTAAGITLGSTLGQVRRAYPKLSASGTDFYRAGALTFGVAATRYPPPSASLVYEIKVNACPAAL